MYMFLPAVGLLLLSAYVGAQCVADAVVPWWWLAGAAAAAVSGAAPLFVVAPRHLLAPGVHYAVAVGAAAWAAGVFPVYARAVAATPLLLVWLEWAHARGRVRYDPTTAAFAHSRAVGYAALRSLTAAVATRNPTSFPRGVARLVPLAASTLETLGMLVLGWRTSYDLPRPADFAAYAVLKAVVFAALPLLEEALATTPPWV